MATTHFQQDFFVTGGTLAVDSPSYVVRPADRDLYEALLKGELCYVLTSRQMGKSSLMVRAAAKLRKDGLRVAVIDLTAIGQDLTKEQWYSGLIEQLNYQLGLDDLDLRMPRDDGVPPLRRWLLTLQRLIHDNPVPLVIFIDEVDVVLSLPFPTDEFFSATRELFNRRASDPRFRNLTLCLLGAASPTDLIKDMNTTPFNVGRRIELTDFEESEVQVLMEGMSSNSAHSAENVLRRVLYWTGGHPYLTQRLCQHIAESHTARTESEVDLACRGVFIENRAAERDDNLIFVRDRMLHSGVDTTDLLTLYRKVWRGGRVADDGANPLVTVLRLSGMVRLQKQKLVVRNRIFRTVFDLSWIASNLPDADVRRERAAYRRGLLRATIVAGLIISVVVTLGWIALQERNRSRLLLYATQLQLAERSYSEFNFNRARDLLESGKPDRFSPDLRGFEWYVLWNLTHDNSELVRIEARTRSQASFSPDGRVVGVVGADGSVHVYDLRSGKATATILPAGSNATSIAFAPNSDAIAVGSQSGTVLLCSVTTPGCDPLLQHHDSGVTSLSFSPSGRQLAVAGGASGQIWAIQEHRVLARIGSGLSEVQAITFCSDNLVAVITRHEIELWDSPLRRRFYTFIDEQANDVAVSADGDLLAAADISPVIRIWDLRTGQNVAEFRGSRGANSAIAFSPDGKRLVVGSVASALRIWDIKTRQLTAVYGGQSSLNKVSFSPDGSRIYSAGLDGTIRVWDTSRGQLPLPLVGSDEIYWMAFSSDSSLLAGGGNDGKVYIWTILNHGKVSVLDAGERVRFLKFSHDGNNLVVGTKHTLQVWTLSGHHDHSLLERTRGVMTVAMSRDNNRLAVLDNATGSLSLWRAAEQEPLREFEIQQLEHLDAHQFNTMDLSPTGSFAVIGTVGGKVLMLNLDRNQLPRLLADTDSRVYAVGISRDGRYAATGHGDYKIRVWDLKTLRLVRTLVGHNAVVKAVAFSPDGKRLASASDDGSVKFWDANSGLELVTFGHLETMMEYAIFSSDGNYLAAAGDDHLIRMWDGTPRSPR